MVCPSQQILFSNQIKKNEISEHVKSMGERYIKDLVWKPEEKRPLGRPRRRGKDNIKQISITAMVSWNGCI
jgi:hypothetical protein